MFANLKLKREIKKLKLEKELEQTKGDHDYYYVGEVASASGSLYVSVCVKCGYKYSTASKNDALNQARISEIKRLVEEKV